MEASKKLLVLLVAGVALAGATTALAAATAGGAKPSKLTGYPTKINRIDLSGYQIETSYPLGKLDAGSTYLQTYTGDHVTAKAIAGPYVGSAAVTYTYVALPVTHNVLLLVWLEGGFKHNSFVYDMNDHISSVVTWDKPGDPSLGSVTIVRKGSHPIP